VTTKDTKDTKEITPGADLARREARRSGVSAAAGKQGGSASPCLPASAGTPLSGGDSVAAGRKVRPRPAA